MGVDDAKRYIVIEATDFDVHGAMMQLITDALRAKDDALVTALCVRASGGVSALVGGLLTSALTWSFVRALSSREDPAAAKAYLKALTEEPYVEEQDLDDGDDTAAAGDSSETTNGGRTRRSLRRSAKENEDEDDDDENFEVQLTYPLPPCSSDIVTITRSDISRLRPAQYLNDNIIDYYFKCVESSVVAPRWHLTCRFPWCLCRRLMLEDFSGHPYVQKNVLFLSSHFYSRLRMGKGTSVAERLEAGYKNVSTWLTRADLFRRSMVFVPINKECVCGAREDLDVFKLTRPCGVCSMHWSLAIILNPRAASVEFPDEVRHLEACTFVCSGSRSHTSYCAPMCALQNQPPSRIAVLDPLGAYHNKQAILRNLRSFLQFEWERTYSAAVVAAAATQANSGDGNSGMAPRRRQQAISSKYHPAKVELLNVKAPQQQNSYDCGVYVIKFANVILDNYVLQSLMFGAEAAISKEAIDNKLEELLTSKEFGAEQIAEMRGTIKDAIEQDTLQYHAALEQQQQQRLKEQTPEQKPEPITEAEAHEGVDAAGQMEDMDVEV